MRVYYELSFSFNSKWKYIFKHCRDFRRVNHMRYSWESSQFLFRFVKLSNVAVSPYRKLPQLRSHHSCHLVRAEHSAKSNAVVLTDDAYGEICQICFLICLAKPACFRFLWQILIPTKDLVFLYCVSGPSSRNPIYISNVNCGSVRSSKSR